MNIKQFSESGFYRIVLQGELNRVWFERLGSMRILQKGLKDKAGNPVTVLEGPVMDQAELSGILNTLNDLHLLLLSVKCLDKTYNSSEH